MFPSEQLLKRFDEVLERVKAVSHLRRGRRPLQSCRHDLD